MNLRESFPVILLACAAAGWPAERISADRLENIVASACSNGAADAQVAHSLADIELTERLPIGRLESLLALPVGPRTRDVLQMVADVSAFLEQPAAQAAPAEVPSDEQQQEMLARAREYTLGYIRALPDFVAFKMTRRFDDYPFPKVRTEVWNNLIFRDSEAGQLTYNNGVESNVDNPAAHGGPGIVRERQGLSSFGEFGSIIGALFWDDSHIQLTWSHWETVSDKRLAVFHYSIPADHSRYIVSYCCDEPDRPVSVAAAYRGDLFVDPATGGIWRITREALGLPPRFPTHWAKTIVDYRPVSIASASYLLPVRSMTYSESIFQPYDIRTIRYWNDVRFVQYRRFAAEARLVTGEETQAPPEDEAPPEQAPEPWLERDRPEQPTAPEAPVRTPPASQTGVATIRTSVQLVEVPVIVKDRRGEPVTGLKKEDFEVYDNGVREDVRVFLEESSELKTVETKAPAVSRNQVFSNRETQHRMPDDSTFIAIDTHGMDWAERAYARLEIVGFLRDLPETERSHTYLVVGSNFIPLQETKHILNRLADDRDFAVNPFGFPPSGEAAKWTCAVSLSEAEFYMKALAGLAQQLAAIPGRKNVIWATASFPLASAQFTCTYLMPPLLRILNNANVAVYPIETPGLKTAFADATTEVPMKGGVRGYDPFWVQWVSQTHTGPIYANQRTMLELSEGTGGRAFLNANRADSDLRTALEDTRGSYWLGFYPNLHNDNQYHRILVKIADRTDLHPRYREGYFDNAAPAEKKSFLQSALEDTTDDAGIPLTAELERHGGNCEMKLKIGLAPVALQEEGERHTGKLEILVAERNVVPAPELKLKLQQTLGLQLKTETYEQTMRDGFPYRYSFTPKSGVTSLRVAVHDPGSGAVGSLTVPVAGCGN